MKQRTYQMYLSMHVTLRVPRDTSQLSCTSIYVRVSYIPGTWYEVRVLDLNSLFNTWYSGVPPGTPEYQVVPAAAAAPGMISGVFVLLV